MQLNEWLKQNKYKILELDVKTRKARVHPNDAKSYTIAELENIPDGVPLPLNISGDIYVDIPDDVYDEEEGL